MTAEATPNEEDSILTEQHWLAAACPLPTVRALCQPLLQTLSAMSGLRERGESLTAIWPTGLGREQATELLALMRRTIELAVVGARGCCGPVDSEKAGESARILLTAVMGIAPLEMLVDGDEAHSFSVRA